MMEEAGGGPAAGVRQIPVEEGDEGLRLDRWLRSRFPGLGQGRIEKLLRSGQIRVDGGRVRASRRLAPGEVVRMPPLREEDQQRTSRPAVRVASGILHGRVLYEDESLIAIDKPAGLAAQGGTGQSQSVDAMAAGLVAEDAERPRLAHRLDRETTGVLLLGCSRRATAALAAAFRERAVRKVYWAAIAGRLTPRTGLITGGIGRMPEGARRRMGGRGGADMRHARTRYATILTAGDRVSWVALCPETGRTHQLRVHMAEAGAAILGDRRYGERGDSLGEDAGVGLHLHARSLALAHPETGAELIIEAPLPPHMERTWNLLDWNPKDAEADPFGAE